MRYRNSGQLEEGVKNILFFNVLTEIIMGDINDDHEVNVTEVVTLISYIAKNDFSSVDKNSLDLNGDGEVNVTDVVTLILMIGKVN